MTASEQAGEPVLLSVAEQSPIETGGASSFRMVTTPWPTAMSAPTGFERFTKKVSFGSSTPSAWTVGVRTWIVAPGLKVMVPAATS